LLKLEGDRARVGDPERLESYPAFGATLRAPADGKVVRAVDANPDMAIGESDAKSPVGNHVVIEIAPARYVLLAHLRRGSVAVKQGQAVRAGDPVGQCGNSGNTSQPHLHLQVQSGEDFWAKDLRTYPIVFHGARLIRGQSTATGSPRRNDRITVAFGG
jgi:murein DD-endopeptidase MepM/ murein hydrolase activator NlpD